MNHNELARAASAWRAAGGHLTLRAGTRRDVACYGALCAELPAMPPLAGFGEGQ